MGRLSLGWVGVGSNCKVTSYHSLLDIANRY
jgi:hypothetical protein